MDLPVIAAGAAAVFGLMAGLCVYAVRRENAGVVDIGWTAGMMIMAGADRAGMVACGKRMTG